MATNSSTDFFDDFKGYAQGLLVGSFAFGSLFPLALKMINDLFPGMGNETWHIAVFCLVNLIYFVGPLLIGLWAWSRYQKDSSDDLLFRVDFLENPNLPDAAHWQRVFLQGPKWVLHLLWILGCVLMYPWTDFHGLGLQGVLGLFNLVITAFFTWHSCRFYRKVVPILPKDTYFPKVAGQIKMQWGVALGVSLVLFVLANVSFYSEHKHDDLDSTPQKDKDLTITMPFEWQETANHIDRLFVKPIKGGFNTVATEANLLASASLDYNDIVLRQLPDTTQIKILLPLLPLRPAELVRQQLLIVQDTLRLFLQRKYVSSAALSNLLDVAKRNQSMEELLQKYHLDNRIITNPSRSGADSAVRINLLLANQLMPLADNLSEAAEGLKEATEKHSLKLLAEWIKISRIKGLFLLFTFLNMLICGWFAIRLANEIQTREKLVTDPLKPTRPFRELINLKYFLSLTILLILPLFRVVDENSVKADQPFWFLDLPQLIGNVVQPLPIGNNSQGNFVQNQEVLNRLNKIDLGVKALDSASVDQQKVTRDLQKATRDIREVIEELKLR